jgi:hypothetical protein
MVDIIEMLKIYPGINKRILELNQDLNDVVKAKLNADGCLKATIITDEPRSPYTSSEPTYNKTVKLFDKLEEICRELERYTEYIEWRINQLIDDKKRIDEALLSLTHDEYNIVKLRYWDYPAPRYNWNKIITESYYCRSQCFEIHNIAMEKMVKYLKSGLKRTRYVG